jgi:UDP-N-acetylglucosamine--N-acetylmuramyl-(pentapeptide) pyrophosphoryl-undecaprenol N-acetylglucosamine transferase
VRVLIVGGGTGGHLFPAIALAEAFLKKDPENQVRFIVTRRPLDAQVLGEREFSFKVLNVEGIKGKGAAGKIRSMILLPRAFKESLKMIEEIRPEVVLGVGGYVTGPMVLAAWWKGIPCAIQEQNSIPGMTNRMLGKVADWIFLAFDDQGSYFSKRKSRLTGNPIRKELQKAFDQKISPSESMTVLILGGSQGAHRINQAVVDDLDELGTWKDELFFIHQTGEKDEKEIALAYQEKGFHHQVRAFFPDMAGVYGQADMIIARAGAMTLSEITALGKPSLLIPFPFAANNHQEHNARALVKAGAAEMILEKDLQPGFLADRIRTWLSDRDIVTAMGKKAEALGRRQAAEEIVEECYQLVEAKNKFKRSLN